MGRIFTTMYRTYHFWTAALLAVIVVLAPPVCAQNTATQDAAAELAKKLANPISSLISLPIQYNYDENYGPSDDGSVTRINVQPVIPITLNAQWNLISRTIVPFTDQKNVPASGMSASGLGDIVASQFFSPKAPTAGGWIWGAGPVELLPTASGEELGGEKFGLGPTVVVLKQHGPWTVGLLANHIWSVSGEDDRSDISATFVQPFASYITKTKTTLGLNTESTYDWENETWSAPIILQVSQLLKAGTQIMQVSAGAKYWADAPENGPEGWGFRVTLTFLFPK